jgi:hypothetical protein
MSASKWTPETIALLERRLNEGASVGDIAKELGRQRSIVSAKAYYLRNNEKGRPGAGNVCAVNVPPDRWEDRDRRLSAPQTLTGVMFGDPPIGFSALDRRADV